MEASGLKVLARKLKLRQVEAYRDAILGDSSSSVGQVLRQAESGSLVKREEAKIAESFRSRRALGVIAEYTCKIPAALRLNKVQQYEVPGIEFVSTETRAAGASCLALNMDPATGGCSLKDFAAAKIEQASAAKDYPGPLPLLWMDLLVDQVQLAQAYSAGAAAVTIDKRVAADAWRDLADTAELCYGLEVFVVCRPEDLDGDDLGERSVVLVGTSGIEHAIQLRPRIAGCAILKIDAKPGQGLEEAEEAWLARDAGFDAVWLSDVLYKFGAFSGKLFCAAPDSITSVIKAVKSKASANYARASASFSGKGEGAKEYLGDILI